MSRSWLLRRQVAVHCAFGRVGRPQPPGGGGIGARCVHNMLRAVALLGAAQGPGQSGVRTLSVEAKAASMAHAATDMHTRPQSAGARYAYVARFTPYPRTMPAAAGPNPADRLLDRG